MVWNKQDIPTDRVRYLHDRFHLDWLRSSVLVRRGVTDKDKIRFFLENEITFLENPFLFDDMESAVCRIGDALEAKEKIRVFGDRDVDGITSTTLLVTELRRLGGQVDYRLPEGDAPYGLTLDGVAEAKEDGVTLIITVDCGISGCAEIEKAQTEGIDTLVFDHHLPGETLPPALAIIDPKVPGSGYPFPYLAACGVVAKVIWALRFSLTDLFGEEFILLHCQPGNGTVLIQAVKMQNMVEIDRLFEEVNPGLVDLPSSKAAEFFADQLPILVLDAAMEKNQLRQAFGPEVEINLVDMRPELEACLPMIKGKSLFTLSSISHVSRYTDDGRDELLTLISLWNAFVAKKYPLLGAEYKKILDLVAVGTIADLMPMVHENRILVKQGLEQVEKGSRENLLPLLAMKKLTGRKLSGQDISWNLAPVINASGRMGQPSVAVDMLLAENSEEAGRLATTLVGLNNRRKKLGEKCWPRINSKAKESYERTGSKMVVVHDPESTRGITGLMAGRVSRQFNAPAMILANADGRVIGSMRSPHGFNCVDFLTNFSSMMLDFGGHAYAAGFSMEKDVADRFITAVYEQVDEMAIECTDEDIIEIDCSLPPDYLTPSLIDVVEFFEPFGESNPPLNFLIENAVIRDAVVLNNNGGGNQHLKLTLEYGKYRWPALWWRCAHKLHKEFEVGDTVDVVFTFSRNYFRLHSSLQLTVVDLKKGS